MYKGLLLPAYRIEKPIELAEEWDSFIALVDTLGDDDVQEWHHDVPGCRDSADYVQG